MERDVKVTHRPILENSDQDRKGVKKRLEILSKVVFRGVSALLSLCQFKPRFP